MGHTNQIYLTLFFLVIKDFYQIGKKLRTVGHFRFLTPNIIETNQKNVTTLC